MKDSSWLSAGQTGPSLDGVSATAKKKIPAHRAIDIEEISAGLLKLSEGRIIEVVWKQSTSIEGSKGEVALKSTWLTAVAE